MKTLMVTLGLGLMSTLALAQGGQKIDPATTQLPWMNSAARDAVWKLSDHPNGVTVFEAYSITCTYCNQNAAAVDALADQFKNDPRVSVLDLGLDSSPRDFARWVAAHHPNHPVVKDANHTVFNALKQDDAIPQTFVVACDGTLVAEAEGAWDDAAKQTLVDGIAKAEQVTCP